MESHTGRKTKCLPVFKNPIWKLKYEQDQNKLTNKLQKQLSNDFLRLYEDCHLVDLRLKTSQRLVSCHSFIVESRFLPLWSLLCQLARLQKRKTTLESTLTISIPSVDYFSLDCFIRSLYTEEINETLWPSLKLQIEACFPKAIRKPIVIESLDIQEEKKIEVLIAEQIKKGRFSFEKSSLSNFLVGWGGPAENVPRSEDLNRDLSGIQTRGSAKSPPKTLTAAGMTSEPGTTGCHPDEVVLRPKGSPLGSEEGGRPLGRGGRHKKKSLQYDTESDARRKSLSEDAIIAHNAAGDDFCPDDTSSLEVELESSNDGQISSPSPNNRGCSSRTSDDPANQPLTRTGTFEVIAPLTRSTVFGDDRLESGACVLNGHEQSDNMKRAAEREKGSLIFDNNFHTYSNVPTSNLMTLSSDIEPGSLNRSSMEDDPLSSSFNYLAQQEDATLATANLVRNSTLSPRDADSPSPDSLYINDSSRLPTKEEYDSEEKEKDDSESFPPLPSNGVGTATDLDHVIYPADGGLRNHRPRRTSASSVRDIDAIPAVGGYSAPLRNTPDPAVAGEESGRGQSIFSMFIDFNEIPSPKKVAPKPKKIAKSQSGVYMFIDAGACSQSGNSKQESDGCHIATTDPCCSKVAPLDCSSNPDKAAGSKDIPNKGVYMFIEGDSNTSSPKPRRRFSSQNRSCNKENLMTKSAPTDSHLFKGRSPANKSLTPSNTRKMMTKSVIDRDEFMSQPPARRNVSLNEKINEASRIPRPIANFRQKIKSGIASQKPWPPPNKEVNEMKFLDELNQKVESEFDDLKRPNSISEDISSVSDVSSLLNSMDRTSNKRNSHTLGDDLLRMFEKEINTDVTIQVGEKKIRAHKCILSSRCVYFAAMLSGHWVESSGNIIKLQGFSAEAVTVALRHIYSGKSTVPPGVKVVELAALSDMLCLDGLKEVVALHLKANQCHYFHKPCADCLMGVLEVLPIAGAYYLDDLFRRCLKWISKHFSFVLPTRGFATLPPELQEKCIKQIIDEVSVSSAIDTAMGCDRVLCLLPAVKWAHGIIDLANHLFEMVKTFIASNFSNVLSSDGFLSMNTDGHWSIDKMSETLMCCCSQMKLDEAISTHIRLSSTLASTEDEGLVSFSDVFLEMLRKLLNRTEKILMDNANRVSVCRKWPLLPAEIQRKIKESAFVSFEGGKAAKPKLSSLNRVRGSSIEPVIRARASSMGESKLTRSASAAVVPNQKAINGRKLKATSERCQTPPAPLMRHCLQTPLSNKTSTLRAQAAIQRSQSARCVADRPKKLLPSKFTNANIEDKHNMNSKDGSFPTQSDRSRSAIRTSALSAVQNDTYGSRPETPSRHQLGHRRNFSGSHLTHVQKNFESDDNFGLRRHLASNGGFKNCNNSIIPKPIRTQLPVMQRPRVMSASANESQLRYSNLNPHDDSDRSYDDSITPPKVVPSLARSSTFSKD